MNAFRRLLPVLAASALLAGCSAPSASQARRNERQAQDAEGRRAAYEQERAIDDRAATYEKQGLGKSEALSAARAEATGPLRRP